MFRDAQSALLFAMNYADRDHGNAAAAERSIALYGPDRYEREAIQGHGLRGEDAAAQAGMILSRIQQLPPLLQAELTARYTRINVKTRQAACHLLALRARDALPCELPVIVLLLRRHYGLRVDHGRIADQQDVHLQTVRRWQLQANRWIRPISQRAIDEAEKLLEQAGITEPVDSARLGR